MYMHTTETLSFVFVCSVTQRIFVVPVFTTSKYGTPIIQWNGYRYNKYPTKSIGPKNRWICTSQGSKRCKALLVTINGEVVQVRNDHNHPPKFRSRYKKF